MNVLLTGATGLVGSRLAKALQSRNDRVISVARPSSQPNQGILWNPLETSPSKELLSAIQDCDAVVHLAGENIASGRWNVRRKAAIRNSRVCSTEQIANAINAAQIKPRSFLCASAVGYYGDRGNDELTESSPRGNGWLSEVCKDWETKSSIAQCRVVHLRFGVILSKTGGALPKMIRPFRWGLGGPVGNGNQWMSWISIDDAIRAIVHLLDTPEISGAVNIVAPEPVRNNQFSGTVAKTLHRPALFHIPALILRLMLGEMADELLLTSQRVRPGILTRSAFQFEHPNIEVALAHLLTS